MTHIYQIYPTYRIYQKSRIYQFYRTSHLCSKWSNLYNLFNDIHLYRFFRVIHSFEICEFCLIYRFYQHYQTYGIYQMYPVSSIYGIYPIYSPWCYTVWINTVQYSVISRLSLIQNKKWIFIKMKRSHLMNMIFSCDRISWIILRSQKGAYQSKCII